jgi:hypothetical protein
MQDPGGERFIKEGDQFEDASLQEIIILKGMLKKQDLRPWIELICLRVKRPAVVNTVMNHHTYTHARARAPATAL